MARCDQEMCPYWDGHGCPCEAFGIDPPGPDADPFGLPSGTYEITTDNRQETPMPGTFEIHPTTHGTHHLRLKASNGEVVATGYDGAAAYPTPEYPTAEAARAGAQRVQEACAGGAEIVEVEA